MAQKSSFFRVIAVYGLLIALLCALVGASSDAKEKQSSLFPLTIIHVNDLHARYEEIKPDARADTCEAESGNCIAGYARMVAAIKRLREDKSQNPVYFNTGDNFQGTIWYGLLRWNVTAEMLKLAPPDAMTLGNHEFDHGVAGLVPFLKRAREEPSWPVLVANIDTSMEPELSGFIEPSRVMEIDGRRVGLIGLLYDKTNLTTNTGKVRFKSSVETVREEAKRLSEKNVDIIIVLSHCGLEEDRKIADQAGDLIDVIVGGHSHSLLYPKDKTYTGLDIVVDDYPIVVQKPKHKILIVQAQAHGKIVGNLRVNFDKRGRVKSWIGNPEYMDAKHEKDKEVDAKICEWKAELERMGKDVIGSTEVELDGSNCRLGECSLGNFIADAFRHEHKNGIKGPLIAFTQGASLKGNLTVGDITVGDMIRVNPFESTVDIMEISGIDLRKSLEHAVQLDRKNRLNFLQVSGLRVTYKMVPKGEFKVGKVAKVEVQINKKYVPLNNRRIYHVVTNSFIARGGDGFEAFEKRKYNYRIGRANSDVIRDYIALKNPINKVPTGRTILT